MSASNMIPCFHETESFEGGYVDNQHDPGGATNKGVTQAVYTAYLSHHGRPNAPVRGASDADILDIYHVQFWNSVNGDDLYNGLDLVMVDTAWGSGPVEAIKFLQRKINVADDGHFGLLTLAALKPFYNSITLLNEICAEREAFFKSLPTWRYFGVGWKARLNGIHTVALAMNKVALTPAPWPAPVKDMDGRDVHPGPAPAPAPAPATPPVRLPNGEVHPDLMDEIKAVLHRWF